MPCSLFDRVNVCGRGCHKGYIGHNKHTSIDPQARGLHLRWSNICIVETQIQTSRDRTRRHVEGVQIENWRGKNCDYVRGTGGKLKLKSHVRLITGNLVKTYPVRAKLLQYNMAASESSASPLV